MRILTSKLWRNQAIYQYCTVKKDHYDSLSLKRGATQSEIKGAYYKLSMLYHPDKNKGVEAADKFRDITEAYEVLGNVKLRKLYDKGFGFGRTNPNEIYTRKTNFTQNINRTRSAPSGRTIYYDFDEWTRSHYGATFAKDVLMKKERIIAIKRRQIEINDQRTTNFMFLMLTLFLIGAFSTTRHSMKSDEKEITFYDALKGDVHRKSKDNSDPT